MWLLNHGTARKFDVKMLRSIGFEEVFTPKRYPQQIDFRSASVDATLDDNLTVPKPDLDILNAADWYREPGAEAWECANRYFGVLFFIAHHTEMIASAAKHFRGALIWRAFGLDKSTSYSRIIQLDPTQRIPERLRACGERFWMGNAFEHIREAESPLLRNRAVYLPVGMHDTNVVDEWTGSLAKIFFVCPDIGFNRYYAAAYAQFLRDFRGFGYSIGGAQPVPHPDPNVLGFVPHAVHANNMRQYRVMYYHSSEPYHIHYHPFEAIRAGMPLVFMAGGILDRMGGLDQPGRCRTKSEARSKIRRILEDDRRLIEDIRSNQPRMLAPMSAERCVDYWRTGMQHVLERAAAKPAARPATVARRVRRIAIVIPVEYRGGSLRGAKLLAQAIHVGSRQAGEPTEVVLAHIDDPSAYPPHTFDDLYPGVTVRPYRWKLLDRGAARRAMRYSGFDWEPAGNAHLVPGDGIQDFLDCDLWIIVSDRLSMPILPIRPYVCVVYDYLQRYVPAVLPHGDAAFLSAARQAKRVIVTTKFTEQDALQYGGIEEGRVVRAPMLVPNFASDAGPQKQPSTRPYFLWTTNASPHKNHATAVEALVHYYDALGGTLECRVTGFGTGKLFDSGSSTQEQASASLSRSRHARTRIVEMGELPDGSYRRMLAGARFLWHAGRIDNGTFSVVEAASLGVPSLSSDYPAMREMDEQFGLHLNFMDPERPMQMAERLKWMEVHAEEARSRVPSKQVLDSHGVDRVAAQYWNLLRDLI